MNSPVKELQLWRFISEQVKNKIPVMLMLVLESKGSSPGRQGFKMAVTKNELNGSIGGGIMEHKFVELAKERLLLDETYDVRKQLHNKTAVADQSGMICSGEQTIFLYKIRENDSNAINSLIRSLEETRNGRLGIDGRGISFTEKPPLEDVYLEIAGDNCIYIEKSGYKNHLHIVGGGHCALALSKVMSMLDFYIHLYEERKDLNTVKANSFAHEIKIVEDYSLLSNMIVPGLNQYVVIMTFGYRSDNIALRSVIKNNYKYLGMLGSKSKMKHLHDEWKKDGLDTLKLNSINAPVGIQIKSQSPEEIALSIAAEIIRIKNAEL